MTRRTYLLFPLALALAACGSKTQTKEYPMEGEITALDPSAKVATIKAGKIGDWMEAMTMEYSVKPDSEFQKLHVGDRIQAKVVVSESSYYVTNVKMIH